MKPELSFVDYPLFKGWPSNTPSTIGAGYDPWLSASGGVDYPAASRRTGRQMWRRVRYKVTQADGPERIAPELWAGDKDGPSRDYYRLETDKGGRYWVFRDAPTAGGARWWLHGLFG